MRSYLLLAALGTLAGAAPPAGAQSVAGTWTVTYDSDINTSGDVVTVKKRSTGRLALEQRGDSVFGRFKPEGMPDPERALSGTFDGRVLKLTTGLLRRTIRINGQPTEMMTRTDWMGAVEGASMRGTMMIQMGDRPAPPRRWEAVRQ
jgi:hypothetical protein